MAVVASLLITLMTLTLDLELWENFVKLIAKGESWELDEIIIPAFILMIGITVDSLLSVAEAKRVRETVGLYNHMNDEIMEEISTHLTKLLEFRTALMKDAPNAHDVRHELDRMIVKSFNHYERTQRRSNIDSNLMDLVMPNADSIQTSKPPSQPAGLTAMPKDPPG